MKKADKRKPLPYVPGIAEDLKYPEGCKEITGHGEEYPIIEQGAKQVVLDGLGWFRRNMDQHPSKNPKYKEIKDYVSTNGDVSLIECLSDSCERNYIDPTILSFCLVHLFSALRHGFSRYIISLNKGKFSTYKHEAIKERSAVHGDSRTTNP